ncbi:YrhK family protein [Devosia sp.]|uniref:YrhK family protein n=1 Tax=Devosia sp. TaxID=1871048 RepID=UPI003A8E6BBA
MALFRPDTATKSQRNKRIYALYELGHTLVDFAAALFFIIGSVMFFFDAWQTAGTWCFLIGSICFALKPTLRVLREIHYLAIGDTEDVAEKAENG